MIEKMAIAKRRDDLVEAVSVQSQIDWRTAEAIIDQVEHLDNVLGSNLPIESIAVVVTRKALERHYGKPPFAVVDELHMITSDSAGQGTTTDRT